MFGKRISQPLRILILLVLAFCTSQSSIYKSERQTLFLHHPVDNQNSYVDITPILDMFPTSLVHVIQFTSQYVNYYETFQSTFMPVVLSVAEHYIERTIQANILEEDEDLDLPSGSYIAYKNSYMDSHITLYLVELSIYPLFLDWHPRYFVGLRERLHTRFPLFGACQSNTRCTLFQKTMSLVVGSRRGSRNVDEDSLLDGNFEWFLKFITFGRVDPIFVFQYPDPERPVHLASGISLGTITRSSKYLKPMRLYLLCSPALCKEIPNFCFDILHYSGKSRARSLLQLLLILDKATEYGKEIRWELTRYIGKEHNYFEYLDYSPGMTSPFHRGKPQTVDQTFALALRNALNYTERSMFYASSLARPRILQILNSTALEYPPLLMREYNHPYKFITSDGVQKLTKIYSFARPFEASVWLLLLIACVTCSTIGGFLYWLLEKRPSLLTCFFCYCLWFLAPLLQKCDGDGGKVASLQKPCNRQLVRWNSIVFGVWLLMSMIITSTYLAISKCDYTVSHPYKMPWTMLEQLVDFRIYYIATSTPCKSLQKYRDWFVNTEITFNWESRNGIAFACYCTMQSLCNAKLEGTDCHIYTSTYKYLYYKDFNHSESNETSLRFLRKHFYNLQFICHEEWLPKVLENVGKSKVAYMVKEDDFHYYWKEIVEQSSKHPRLQNIKLHHNYKVRDELLVQKTYYTFRFKPISGFFKNVLKPLIDQLSESGIYALWMKCYKIRFPSGKYIRKNERLEYEGVKDFVPINLVNSDIPWVFVAWRGCLLLTLLAFIIEFFANSLLKYINGFIRESSTNLNVLDWNKEVGNVLVATATAGIAIIPSDVNMCNSGEDHSLVVTALGTGDKELGQSLRGGIP